MESATGEQIAAASTDSNLDLNQICRRDIKPENILLSKSMAIKLCDFGLAIDLREERAVTRAGTLEYMVSPC